MNNSEFYTLFRNSKLAQVATPLSRSIRKVKGEIPLHQAIFTPRSAAHRSNYGLKSTLPSRIGASLVAFNDLDNFKSMPDVEKYKGHSQNRLKFQESGLVLKKGYNLPNPLFDFKSSRTSVLGNSKDTLTAEFNLGDQSRPSNVQSILSRNPQLHQEFKKWLVAKSPESVMLRVPSKLEKLLKEFIGTHPTIVRRCLSVDQMLSPRNLTTDQIQKRPVQGTGGFSYSQKGRLSNTPNGIKNGAILPGRIVHEREAAIGGFVAALNERSVVLQKNYAKNVPGKHSRQVVFPLKVNEAEMTPTGGVRMYADGVRVGDWMLQVEGTSYGRLSYVAANPNFGLAYERNAKDSTALESLLGLVSKN